MMQVLYQHQKHILNKDDNDLLNYMVSLNDEYNTIDYADMMPGRC